MPANVRPLGQTASGTQNHATYVVKPGDSLGEIAARTLGRSDRWREIYNLNRGVIGASPNDLKVGTVLRLPAKGLQAEARRDSDGDGVIDKYDLAPDDAQDKRWNLAAARAYGEFAKRRARELQKQGVEVDCADLAVKLLEDFCKEAGLPSPLAEHGKWSVYSPENTGGLPNVNGPNWVRSEIHADNLAKEFTRAVNDVNQDGVSGFADGQGTVDVGDLRPGDILFYDWDGDGKTNHTINVIDVSDDGAVTVAYGSYDNLAGEGTPLTWENLDLSPIAIRKLLPGTKQWLGLFGPQNRLWGARRFKWLPDEPKREPKPGTPPPSSSPGEPVVVAPSSESNAPAGQVADLRARLADVRQFLLGA